MKTESALSMELQTLEPGWERLTEVSERPRSLMDVIEYSLGQQRRAEVYVNRLLKYFLDPTEPHGMDDEFLRAFLTSIPPDSGFEEDVHDLSTVDVAEQVQITEGQANDTSTGYLDLVIQSPNEWLVLVELKFGAPDTQIEFYYRDATHIGGAPKTDYDSGIYYVFLHPQDRPTATEPEFTNWTWEDFTEDVLQECIANKAPRYPQRTATQLHELQDDIKGITGMTDQQEHDQEKIDLISHTTMRSLTSPRRLTSGGRSSLTNGRTTG